MSAKQVSYTFESTLETINHAEEQASRIAAAAGFNEDDTMSIAMAVREAAVNAVLHGNAYDPSKKVTLAFEQGEKGWCHRPIARSPRSLRGCVPTATVGRYCRRLG